MSKSSDFDKVDLNEVITRATDMFDKIFGNIRDLRLRKKLKTRLDGLIGETAAGADSAETEGPEDSAGQGGTEQPIHRPAHYGSKSGQDVIDVAEDFGIINNAYKFNMLKYLLRGGKKPGNSELQDMKKIREYCDRYIGTLEPEG